MIDLTKVTITKFDGIDHSDYPDYCDAYATRAEYNDGTELSEEEMDELNDDRDFVYQKLWDWLH